MLKIAVLVSGGGTNLKAIIDGIAENRLKDAVISMVISDKPSCLALERATKANVPTKVIKDPNDGRELTEMLKESGCDLVVLAGYMRILPKSTVQAFEGKIINIHPSLIPEFCGRGFYGLKVHQAVLEAGRKESGATVHLVDEGVDTGDILLQAKVAVERGDTAERLAQRVLEREHEILIEAIDIWRKRR